MKRSSLYLFSFGSACAILVLGLTSPASAFVFGVPEMAPGMAGSGLLVFAGVLLLLLEKHRRHQRPRSHI